MRPINPQMKYGNVDIKWHNIINRARIVARCPGSWTKGATGVQEGFIHGLPQWADLS